jgi:hypothetical protein
LLFRNATDSEVDTQQIHDKIVSLGFQDAKVYVSNVDSQASAAGGIIIQVLGEMSNAGGQWRKFAQTFFLGEQPNGYFVLNDIFRYLKEDSEAEEEAVDIDEALQAEVAEAASKGEEVVHQVEVQPQSIPAGITAGQGEVVEASAVKETTDESIPATRLQDAQANGIIKAQEPTPAQPDQVGLDKKVTATSAAAIPATKGAAEAAQATSAPSNPNAATPAINGSTAPPPAVPSAPKTWANLAASNVTKWGSTVSAESKGISAVKDSAPAQPAQKAAAPAGPAQSQGFKNQGGPGSVFIKNVVVDKLPQGGLQAALEAQFGPMKECTVNGSKACAFAEFATAEAAQKAIKMSLPVSQGGEGGVKVGTNGWFVIVEEKRKQNDRPQAGGAPRGGGGGGGPRGGGAPVTRGARGGAGGGRGMAGRGGRGGA